ncbi:hypothetical protein MA16_Dca019185 [Dendrobium catenatum]|uniref:Uncharacterized protein n=1 Tax=Dendrobium catenatum TaxID=906689 RepID=A0A2I0VYC3_9ASPA|nr:hypothetical protein MA16_Dca019185 [Dendrobium catenatum]
MDLYNVDGINKEDKEETLAANGAGKSSFFEEDGEFTKVGRKKGKNILPSTPHSTRAKTSSKPGNG